MSDTYRIEIATDGSVDSVVYVEAQSPEEALGAVVTAYLQSTLPEAEA